MKKVTMFVWNHFTNDARVLKEATTLSENGYDVKVIAIDNPKIENLKKREVVNQNFSVERVRMYPIIITTYQRYRRKIELFGGFGAFVFGSILFKLSKRLFSLFTLLVTLFGIVVKVKSMRRNFIKVVRSIRMMIAGIKHNPDVVHSHDLNTLFQGIVTSKMTNSKLIYDSHEVQTERTGYNPKVASIWEKSHVPFIDKAIVENETRAHIFKSMYGIKPTPIYNYSKFIEYDSVENIDLYSMLSIPSDKKILLYQGGLQSGRGLELLIEAQQLLERTVLVLIGDGKLKLNLMEQVASLGLEARVKFIPKVELSELPKYTKQAFVGFQVLQNVNLNHYSASSNKLFEYIMMHVPVIGCDFPEIKTVIEREHVGLAIDASHVQEIVNAVNVMIDDEALYETFKENCAKAKHNYNWKSESEKLLKLYQNI